MKVRVTLKSPDCLYYAAKDIDARDEKESFVRMAEKWFEYGEYLTVEIDTEEESIRVLEV